MPPRAAVKQRAEINMINAIGIETGKQSYEMAISVC